MKFIQTLNLTTYIAGKDKEEEDDSRLDCGMWHSDKNLCEFNDKTCITTHGIYFGTCDSREPKFCPAHYFSDLGYEIKSL